jgi:hypothetical protein
MASFLYARGVESCQILFLERMKRCVMNMQTLMCGVLLCTTLHQVVPAQADEDDAVSTASLTLNEPLPPSPLMKQLPRSVFDNGCWSATNEVLIEVEDGSVVLRHIDRVFNELNTIFDVDLRALRPALVPADDRWYFCFDVFVMPDEFGIYEPKVRTYMVIPQDMSS